MTIPDVLDFGAQPFGPDCTDAFNKALAYCHENKSPKLTIGGGDACAFFIEGELDYIRHPLTIEGTGSALTTIYATGPMSKGPHQGLLTYHAETESINGGGISGLGIIGLSTQARQEYPGAAISCLGTKDCVIGRQIFRDLYVTKDVSRRLGDWMYDVYMDGGNSRAPGIRGNDFYSCHLFGVRREGWAIYCRSGAFKFIGGSTVMAGGVHGGVCITGGDANFAPPSISEGIDFLAASISGTLKLDNTRLSTFRVNSVENIDADPRTTDRVTIYYNTLGYPHGGGRIIRRSPTTKIYCQGEPVFAAAA